MGPSADATVMIFCSKPEITNDMTPPNKKEPHHWTDPQKLDSLIRLPEGIEFGIAPGSIPLVFVWFGRGCSSGYIHAAPL